MAAPIGNQYAAKAKRWHQAIERALEKRSRVEQVEALDIIAEKLLAKCDEGDLAAIKELGDRLDGRPAQSVVVGGDQENPLKTVTRIELVPLASTSKDPE